MIGGLQHDLSKENREALESYLTLHWKRAVEARSQDVEHLYKRFDKQYRAEPAQKERTFPWPKASNIVVPVIRMYLDTFVDRCLNMVFQTRPLVAVQGYPSELRAAGEEYLNLKCRQDWKIRQFAKGWMQRGGKYGTGMAKVFWKEEKVDQPVQLFDGEDGAKNLESIPMTTYSGPWVDHIAYDDWFVYPITANEISEVEILFHRLRYPEEVAIRKAVEFDMTPEEVATALNRGDGAKRDQERRDAGLEDGQYRELHLIECHFNWEYKDRVFRAIALFEPVNEKIVDFQLNQIHPSIQLFHAYRPYPRDDVFPGESMCQILGPVQEEVSQIHNDRRNLSTMASAPIILKKEGVRVPGTQNATFYPGKVYNVEDMDDFRIEKIGGQYQEMLAEENQALALADRVSGISAGMQASSQGQQGKGGVYNARGTMAMLSEGNQRHDTNISDFRLALGEVIKAMFALQCEMDPNDPAIMQLPADMQDKARQFIEMSKPEQLKRAVFEVRVSDAAMNKEARKANLMTMANTLSQFAQQQNQIAQAAINPTLNPALKNIAMETLAMQHGMARALVQEFELQGLMDNIPDAIRAIQSAQQPQPGGMGPNSQPGPQPGMVNGAPTPPGRM